MAGELARLKVLVRMKGKRDAVSLPVTGGSSVRGDRLSAGGWHNQRVVGAKGGEDIVTQQGAELLSLQVCLGRDEATGEKPDAVVVAEVVEPFADPLLHVLSRFDREQRARYGVGVGRQRNGYFFNVCAQFREDTSGGGDRVCHVWFPPRRHGAAR